MKWLLSLLRDPIVSEINVDDSDRLKVHGEMLAKKRILRDVFTEFHHCFRRLDDLFLSGDGARMELGAGVAPIRDTYPDVLATDVVPAPYLDKVMDAECMDLPDGIMRAIYGQNCFHHFPHPGKFFSEAERVLEPGGGVILLEPYYGPFAKFLFKRLFKTEGFDKEAATWETTVMGPMCGANQALSYIVFIRDRDDFHRAHPTLKIVHQELCSNYLRYILSGGLNFRQLVPNWVVPLVSVIEFALKPFNRWLALHHIVVLRKTSL